MVTVRTKDDVMAQKDDAFWHDTADNFMDKNDFNFHYYILNIAKCRFDGELDPKQPFSKLMSISRYKKKPTNTFRVTSVGYFAWPSTII